MQPIPPPQQNQSFSAGPSNEELIEAIIEEKWNELVKDLSTVLEWKSATENTITTMKTQFNDLQSSFDKLHSALLGKIGEYDKHIMDVAAEIKAMEDVFSKVLPTFTDNVSQLNRITDDINHALGKK
jgi:septation ring formation regulator EzrA